MVASKCYILTPFIQKWCTNFYAVRNIIAIHFSVPIYDLCCCALLFFFFISLVFGLNSFSHFVLAPYFIFVFILIVAFFFRMCESSLAFAPLLFGEESESSEKKKKDILFLWSLWSFSFFHFSFLHLDLKR